MPTHPQPDTSEVLTLREAAARLRVHPETVRRWVQAGDLPAIRVGRSGQYRVRAADLAKVVRSA